MRIGIIGALDEEIQFLRDSLGLKQSGSILGKALYKGECGGNEVVLANSGVGKVRAASLTQCLIDRAAVGRLIFIGVAGAINPQLMPGDVVVSNSALQHDFHLPPRTLHPENLLNHIDADSYLVDLAITIAERLGFQVRRGLVLSGDQVIEDRSKKEQLWRSLAGDCVEMEGAAVAMVCYLNRVPFVLIRGISDLADHNVQHDAKLWLKESSERAARVAIGILSSLR